MLVKGKKILFLLSIFIIIFLSVLFLGKDNKVHLKGEIVIWTEEKYYSYFTEVSQKFKNSNKRVNINVISVDENEYLNKLLTTDKEDLPNIVHLDFIQIDKIRDKIDFFDENRNIIETYNKNFSDSKLNEVQINGRYYGIPFESNPIALYIREDILARYGYKVEDINTWSQLISIGNDIRNKTSNELNLFSSKDKDNIILLILSQLVDINYKNNANDDLLIEMKKIYKEEYLTEGDNYLFRIDSLDFYSDIVNSNINGNWVCKNPPSFNIGENKLYDIGGENLVALNVEKNKETIKEFIAYATTNKELLSDEFLKWDFLPSSLYSLRLQGNDKSSDNIKGSSPLLTLINIVERAPGIINYGKLKDLLIEVYKY